MKPASFLLCLALFVVSATAMLEQIPVNDTMVVDAAEFFADKYGGSVIEINSAYKWNGNMSLMNRYLIDVSVQEYFPALSHRCFVHMIKIWQMWRDEFTCYVQA